MNLGAGQHALFLCWFQVWGADAMGLTILSFGRSVERFWGLEKPLSAQRLINYSGTCKIILNTIQSWLVKF